VYFFSPLLPLPLLFSCVLLRRESFTVDCGTTVERRDGSDPHPVGFVLTAGGAQRSRLPPPPRREDRRSRRAERCAFFSGSVGIDQDAAQPATRTKRPSAERHPPADNQRAVER